VLNGFGKPEEIEAVQTASPGFGVKVAYSAPTCRIRPRSPKWSEMNPRPVRADRTSWSTMPASTRGAATGVSGSEVGRDPRHQSELGLPHHTAVAALDDRNKWGRIINIASAQGWSLGLQVRLCGGEARNARPHQGDSARDGRARHHCNAICQAMSTRRSWRHRSKARRRRGIPREQVIREVLLAQQPNKRFATVTSSARLPCSSPRMRPPRSLARRSPSMAVGPHIRGPGCARRNRPRNEHGHPPKALPPGSRQPNPQHQHGQVCSCCKVEARSAPIRAASISAARRRHRA